MPESRSATLYRMVLPDHTCPFGVRAKEMLEREGFEIDEHILESREETDAFKAEHGVVDHAAGVHRRGADRRQRGPAALPRGELRRLELARNNLIAPPISL